MQVKLLRVLQERVFERVGNHQPIRCNVRIIAATHRNLEDAITRGQFRGDLFYRLNVFPIEMPSLRERVEDLELLIGEFARQNVDAGRALLKITPRAMAALKAYTWPGNVRELGNLIERLSVLSADGVVDILDLPTRYRAGFLDDNAVSQLLADLAVAAPLLVEDVAEETDDTAAGEAVETTASITVESPVATDVPAALDHEERAEAVGSPLEGAMLATLPADGLDLKAHLYAIEQKLILDALARSSGTVSQAARLLGLRRTTLVEKMRRFGMSVSDATD